MRLTLPSAWLSRDSNLCAFHLRGDAMMPVLHEDFVVVVDTLQRDPAKLIGEMVVVREPNGVTVRCLRHDGDVYLLEPHSPSAKYPVRVMRETGEYALIGAVVSWIGVSGVIGE